jgi:hypothetical protein
MEEKLKYPIGKFQWIENPSQSQLENAIAILTSFSEDLEKIVSGLSEEILNKHYRPGGWTIAQVVHHLADSHMHCYLRMKHATLEDKPAIKDYNEGNWANTEDGTSTNISSSLDLIKALHKRWVVFLNSLEKQQWKRSYFHPEREKFYPLDTTVLLYAWHCEHHLAHIQQALN